MAEHDDRDGTDEPGADLRTEWLREPPGAGEVRLMVDLGEGAELTPEAQAALERLMTELNDAEVTAYQHSLGGLNVGIFGGLKLESTCVQLSCAQHTCSSHECGTYTSIF